jgi:hypothetical protein
MKEKTKILLFKILDKVILSVIISIPLFLIYFVFLTPQDLDEKTVIFKCDSIMIKYIENISLDTIFHDKPVKIKNYFIWYTGTGIEPFCQEVHKTPIIGSFGGSFGSSIGPPEMNRIYKKLKKNKIDNLFLVEVKNVGQREVHYNKERITTKTPWGEVLDVQENDVNRTVTVKHSELYCRLIDLKTLKVINKYKCKISGFLSNQQSWVEDFDSNDKNGSVSLGFNFHFYTDPGEYLMVKIEDDWDFNEMYSR